MRKTRKYIKKFSKKSKKDKKSKFNKKYKNKRITKKTKKTKKNRSHNGGGAGPPPSPPSSFPRPMTAPVHRPSMVRVAAGRVPAELLAMAPGMLDMSTEEKEKELERLKERIALHEAEMTRIEESDEQDKEKKIREMMEQLMPMRTMLLLLRDTINKERGK